MTLRQDREKVVYFADWNPDKLEGRILPLTKVGISSNPEQRITEYTIPPYEPEIVAVVDSCEARNVEQELHTLFETKGWKIDGEWFDLPDSVIGWAERNDSVSKGDALETNWWETAKNEGTTEERDKT
jgi:hypothetical protein